METGAITGYIDVAQLVLYGFWIFFFGLIYYLRQEDRREGYPLHTEERGEGASPSFFFIPKPKTFDLHHGGSVTAPNGKREQRAINLEKQEVWPGAPYVPTGDPMADGVGPAAWAERADVPDMTAEGHAKIVPLRVATDFAPSNAGDDPRGYAVVAGDDKTVGTVSDLWVDKAEQIVRYIEIELADGGRKVLLPKAAARIGTFLARQDIVTVNSLYAHNFAGIPAIANPDQITLLEEDKIQGYVAGGNMYADPERAEPIL